MTSTTQKAPYSPRARKRWAAVTLVLAALCWVEAQAFVFTNNTTISALNTDYEGQDLVISNCVLTVDGPHSFASVRLALGGTLTHSAAGNGTISVTVPVLDEPQVLTGTNAVILVSSNIVLSSLVVKDFAGALVYTNNIDYVLGTAGGQTSLQRTELSTIPDGSLVLVTYDYLYGATNSGLNLTIAGDLELEPGAAITADGRGYSGSNGAGRGGWGGSPITGGGGGHGGYGGISSSNYLGGTVYDSVVQPIDKGSGGGNGTTGTGGAGGGALRLVVGGAARINGSLSVNGADGTATRSGGGAGGSIWLTAQTLEGNGTLSSDGGAGEPIHGGGGAGGRIALYFETNLFSGTIVARGGSGFGIGGAGTIYREASDSSVKQLLLDNGGRSGTNTPIQVVNSADVTVSGSAVGSVSGSLTVRKLVLAQGSRLIAANPAQPITLTSSSAIIQSGASLLLDGLGFPARSGNGYGGSYTSGTAVWGSGAGHGGNGGFSGYTSAYPGMYYGSPTAPNMLGSGGGGLLGTNVAGAGGGAVRMMVTDGLVLDGRISANGTSGLFAGGGGGSGGSVWLTVGTLSGAGSITANGGNGILPTGGGGSGGRVAIEFSTNLFAGSITAYGGSGTNGGAAGTIYFKSSNQQNGTLVVDNGGNACTNTPLTASGTYSLTVKGAARAQAINSQTFLSGLLVASNGWFFVATYPSSVYGVTVNGDAAIETGGHYFADGFGFPGNQGPGTGRYYYYSPSYSGGGGGHGGAGGSGSNSNAVGGAAYESAISPNQIGSGGGYYYGQDYGSSGGAGGGFIGLTVSGTLLVNGSISANGTTGTATGAGGGSGGTVRLIVGTLTGTGSISADGGSGNGPAGGGGGGGRISLSYLSNLFTGTLSAFGGAGAKWGGAGTIYTKAYNQPMGQMLLNNNGFLSGTNTPFYEPGFSGLTITGGAIGSLLTSVSVASLTIASNSWLSMSTASLTVSDNAVLDAGGGITADGTGNPATSGPGAGSSYGLVKGGGGHGGYGAGNFPGGGGVYDSLSSPTMAGSGGGSASGTSRAPAGGSGGGVARLTVNQTLTLNGRISADGVPGDLNSGGGSGGSVWLTVGTLTGTGAISANGGNGNGSAGGGGGGRIALNYARNFFSGPLSARGGSGSYGGGAGTIYLKANSDSLGAVLVDNGGLLGTNTPLSSSYGLPTAPFPLSVQSGAIVHFLGTPPVLSNLVVGAGGLITSLPAHTNIDLAVLNDLTVAPGAAIAVDGKGFVRGGGPGAGATFLNQGGGGAYGGAGGSAASGAIGGTNYGSAVRPVERGSGGGAGSGPYAGGSEGGGAIHLTVGGTLRVDGRLSANGNAGWQDDAGGGAGGAVWLAAAALAGNGAITADGGAGELFNGGGGGGGRIALYLPLNTFTGMISAVGGQGAWPAGDGTVYTSGTLEAPVIVSQTPLGLVSNAVSSVDLMFSTAVNPFTATASAVVVQTPTGMLAQSNLAVTALSPTLIRVSFPQQTTLGDYSITVGTQLQNLFGQPMAQAYTGGFSILLPAIQGVVTNSDGQAVAGVVLQPNGGQSAATTDANGAYTVGVVNGWNGSITPSLPGYMFVPASRTFNNVETNLAGQDFLMVTTIMSPVSASASGTNISFKWTGISGVTYQVVTSTNLVNWVLYGSPVLATNGPMELLVPLGADPSRFYRLRAQN